MAALALGCADKILCLVSHIEYRIWSR